MSTSFLDYGWNGAEYVLSFRITRNNFASRCKLIFFSKNKSSNSYVFFLLCQSKKKSISRLIQFLDSNLVTYKDFMIKTNFDRLLKKLWLEIIETVKVNILKDNTVRNFVDFESDIVFLFNSFILSAHQYSFWSYRKH